MAPEIWHLKKTGGNIAWRDQKRCDRRKAFGYEDLVKKAIQNEANLNDLINNALIAAMDVVGERFSKSEIFVPEMQNVIKVLRTRGMREKVKVVIGGAPVDADFAEKIGADAYGKDAAEAVKIARSFTNK